MFGLWHQITLSRRRTVFCYDLIVLIALLIFGLALLHVTDKGPVDHTALIQLLGRKGKGIGAYADKYRLFINAAWLGALGGIVISLKGVYDNAGNPPWNNSYNLWHLGRPFSGAVTGLITALIFVAINSGPVETVHRAPVYIAAFILGTQEARFFNFLSEIGRIFVQVPASMQPPGLHLTGVWPSQGKAGDAVGITGQSIEAGAVVKIGGMRLKEGTVAGDGKAVNGKVPALGPSFANQAVDVTVSNPTTGTTAILTDKFKYLGD